MLFNKTVFSFIVVILPLSSVAHDEVMPPIQVTEQSIRTLTSTEPWLSDAEFVYGKTAAAFDLAGYLHQHAPKLLPYQESLVHWCGYFSINPKLVLLLLDLQSESVSEPTQPFGNLSKKTGFEAQLKDVLSILYSAYYQFRFLDNAQTQTLNAATYALLVLFNTDDTVELRQRFRQHYARLFTEDASKLRTPKAKLPSARFLQLPWRRTEAWYFNGVHTTTGSDPGIMSSIDFTKSWGLVWGDNTQHDFVTAAHPGIVTVFSSCFVRVTSTNGWATNYYHLGGLRVSDGANVKRNQILGIYANSKDQALCQGGSSTGPHVHFSLLKYGEFYPLSGVSLSGYRIHSGQFSYDSNPTNMWLEKNQQRYFAYQQPLKR
ncbi:M23 family metallopeptidase [Methylocucumis oryzae]|nr:M23 family metallopeptidase [Methylocucumis oryzae]